ncbi:RagB/SusD family nutrient uptake outer membrane protein [Flammeovirgaceae bacterium SG7u.111]|nr:RagB/SusD family nutrient uptake outer membrane protein [Flammeovirgaceae bacterium SG7u.132]WPO36281.1 RagB/SusD family nutrient uptake outer membrane protein [Flammeovirgaceae bacterium SG7u.111]
MSKKTIISIIAFAIFTIGCSDEFLETEPSEFISANRIEEISEINPALQASNLQGIYANMYLPETGGTTGADDFGQKGYDIMSDFLSGDLVLGNTIYGWYSTFTQYQITVDYTQLDNYQFWRYYYRIIFGANFVIDGLGGEDATPETVEGQYIMGQAKAMRAYGYFYLAQYFDEEYDQSSMLLPIYRNTSVPNQPLSPTSDVYNLIVSDLTDAITLLDGFSRDGKFAVNQDVARGLLAYTYAAMGDHANAAAQAEAVINTGSYSIKIKEEQGTFLDLDDVEIPLTDLTNGFNDVSDPSWMWGTDLTSDMGLGLTSWWGKMDLFSYSYAWAGDYKSINFELYNAIPADDIRKFQFNAFSADDYVAVNKFYSPERQIGGASRVVTSDLVYMRIEEMYLLHAESAAKSGNEAGARTSLKAVVEERVPDASYIDGLSGQALLDEIILQTRIEFFAEGKSYLLKKRNKIDIVTGSNHIHIPNTTLAIDSDELSVKIPQSEIQNNPEISLGDI